MMMKPLLTALAATILGGAAWSNGPTTFTQIKGVREFTGTMIVRPVQTQTVMKRGVDPRMAALYHDRALARVRQGMMKIDKDIDYAVVRVPKGMNESSYATSLMNTGDYEYVVPNWRVFVLGTKTTPNDPRFNQQWHHKTIHSEEAWTVWRGTSNVTVAIVDTGVMITHEDLKGGMVKGFNAVDRLDEVNGGDVVDTQGHGTHCAGDAAAQGNNGIGLVGEGWNYKIMPVRASINGSASFDDLVEGAKWAVNHGAKTISVSFSGVDTPLVGSAGTYIKSHGGLLLWAAGNDARDLSGFSYADTIVVGASDESDGRANFSAYGRGVAVFAPGTNIMSTTLGGGYGPASGTSMATPVTNGVCAMIWSINPALTPAKVQSILYNSCDQIGSPSIFGHGRVNLYKAALAAKATLNVKINFPPIAVSTVQGTYQGGSLNDIINGTGSGYLTNSITLTNVGQSMVDEVKFKINYPLSTLRILSPTFDVSATPGSSATAMIYMFNRFTQRYEQYKAAAVPNDGSNLNIAASLASPMNFTPYVANDGTVRVAIRVLSPIGRRGEIGAKFSAKVKKAQLKTEAQQSS